MSTCVSKATALDPPPTGWPSPQTGVAIGPSGEVFLTAQNPALLEVVASVFAYSNAGAAVGYSAMPGAGTQVHVAEVNRKGRTDPEYWVTRDGVSAFRAATIDALLRSLEKLVASCLISQMGGYYPFHSGGVVCDGKGILLPGSSGAGKSTLTAALALSGCAYFTDEVALVDPAGTLWPFPKAIALKHGGLSRVRSVFANADKQIAYQSSQSGVSYLQPQNRSAGYYVEHGAAIAAILFPAYTAGAKPRLQQITKSEAFVGLFQQPLEPIPEYRGLVDLLALVVAQADCFRLVFGDDLKGAVGLVHDALAWRPDFTAPSS